MFEAIGNKARLKKANAALISGVVTGDFKVGHRFEYGLDSKFEISEVGEDDVEIVRMATESINTLDVNAQPHMNTGGPVDTKFFEDRSVDTEKPQGGYMPPKPPILGPRLREGERGQRSNMPAGGGRMNTDNPAGGMSEPKDVFGPYPVSEKPLRRPLGDLKDGYSASTNTNGGNDMTRRPIEELLQGEIFSINPKGRKLVLSSIDPAADTVTVTALEKDLGDLNLSFSDIKGHDVFVWEKPAEEPAPMLPEAFDRVAKSNLSGTVLTVDSKNFTARVLWDAPIDGKQVISECLTEIRPLGVKASGTQLDFSQKVAIIIKEGEQLAAMDNGTASTDTIKQEISQQIAGDKQKMEAAMQKKVQEVVNLVVDSNLQDLKRIEQNAVSTITVGAHNYEVNEIIGIVGGYQDYIFNRVADTMKTHHVQGATELQVPVTAGVMKVVSDNMLQSYFLTRNGYIVPEGNKWAAYSKGHELLATFSDKDKAKGHVRTRDYRIRKGLDA